VFTRYVLAEFTGVDVEASIAWFFDQSWRCDCRVVFFSDATEEEKMLFNGVPTWHYYPARLPRTPGLLLRPEIDTSNAFPYTGRAFSKTSLDHAQRSPTYMG
jgi:hypothetical protein